MNKNRLLYVDDEAINLQLFKFNFQQQFDLILANSGEEALDIISKEMVSIIVSDLKMPKMNGIELINKIKESYPDKVCFMLSAYSIDEAVEMGLDKSKIFEYITKPWKREEIINLINNACE
jgi:response regulator RpfG family c-di-GMP phosphodiesterase